MVVLSKEGLAVGLRLDLFDELLGLVEVGKNIGWIAFGVNRFFNLPFFVGFGLVELCIGIHFLHFLAVPLILILNNVS